MTMLIDAERSGNCSVGRKIITMQDVLAIIPATRQTLYRWMESEGFPRPIKLGKFLIGFREAEVMAWISSRPRLPVGNDDLDDRR
ncbi:MAG: AlpA family phage regulatory protein [Proteobacteria bacterium]|nr:AlpA family phage regulatory protein [Pseudomonadota bacterium]